MASSNFHMTTLSQRYTMHTDNVLHW